MEAGRTPARRGETGDAARMHDAMGDLPELVAADRRWDAVVAGDSQQRVARRDRAWQAEHALGATPGGAEATRRGGGGFGRPARSRLRGRPGPARR